VANIFGFVDNMIYSTNKNLMPFTLLNQNELMKFLYNLIKDSSYLQYKTIFVLFEFQG